jgi:hypothetical protein
MTVRAISITLQAVQFIKRPFGTIKPQNRIRNISIKRYTMSFTAIDICLGVFKCGLLRCKDRYA